MNWAKAKVRLEGMTAGERLAIVTDDPRAERDIPLAAESEGWAVIEIARRGRALTIVIER